MGGQGREGPGGGGQGGGKSTVGTAAAGVGGCWWTDCTRTVGPGCEANGRGIVGRGARGTGGVERGVVTAVGAGRLLGVGAASPSAGAAKAGGSSGVGPRVSVGGGGLPAGPMLAGAGSVAIGGLVGAGGVHTGSFVDAGTRSGLGMLAGAGAAPPGRGELGQVVPGARGAAEPPTRPAAAVWAAGVAEGRGGRVAWATGGPLSSRDGECVKRVVGLAMRAGAMVRGGAGVAVARPISFKSMSPLGRGVGDGAR